MTRNEIEKMKRDIHNQLDTLQLEYNHARDEMYDYENQMEDLDEALEKLNIMNVDDDNLN